VIEMHPFRKKPYDTSPSLIKPLPVPSSRTRLGQAQTGEWCRHCTQLWPL